MYAVVFPLIAIACALLQPKQPHSWVASIMLCAAFYIATKESR